MRFQRRLIAVNLEKVVDVVILLVLQNIKAHAPRLIPLGAERIDLDCFEEAFTLFRLYPDLHPHGQHTALLSN
jgi:hypothetical protein